MRTRWTQLPPPGPWVLMAALIVGAGLGAESVAGFQPGAATDEEIKAFVVAMERVAARGDAAGLMSLIDYDAILKTATADVSVSATFRDSFRKHTKESLAKGMSLAKAIVEPTKKGGSFQFLRARVIDDRDTLLFRLVDPDTYAVSYIAFAPARRPGGHLLAADIYTLSSGAWVSQILRRIYLQRVAYEQRGVIARLLGTDRELVENAPKLVEINALHKAGKNREALAIYDRLPPLVQNDKLFMLQRIQIAQKLDDNATYLDALERFRASYPKDAAADFHAIDAFTLLKQYDKAMAAIDRVDALIGGDPYLNVARAECHLVAGRHEQAREAARSAIQSLPGMVPCYFSLILADLALKDYRELLATLKKIDEQSLMEFEDLTKAPAYAEFVKSPQYEEWLNYLRNKKPQ